MPRFRIEWMKRSGFVVVEAETKERALLKARGLFVRIPKNQEEFPGEFRDEPFVLPVYTEGEEWTKHVTTLDVADENFTIKELENGEVVSPTQLLEVL